MSEDSPKQTSPHDVFVSYASQDVGIADAIVATLETSGRRCWIAPRDVTPGALYADGIIRAINEAKVLVLVLSASSIASKHVGKEVERASSKGRPLIALKLDATTLTTALEYFLSESQWIDAAALGMPAALEKLTRAVGKVLASPEPVSSGGAGLAAPANSATERSSKSSKGVAFAAAIVVGLSIVVGVAVHFWPSKGTAPAVAAISDKSIAVLPFTDMSQKKNQEYFGDGMAEEILDLLAKIPGLTVIARTSSFQFKGRNVSDRRPSTHSVAGHVRVSLGVAGLSSSSARDTAHQRIYRNFRVDSLEAAQIEMLPPLPNKPPPARPLKVDPVFESANYPALTEMLRIAASAALELYVILSEDTYESFCGDGKFHDFSAIRFTEAAAREYVDDAAYDAQTSENRRAKFLPRIFSIRVEVQPRAARSSARASKRRGWLYSGTKL